MNQPSITTPIVEPRSAHHRSSALDSHSSALNQYNKDNYLVAKEHILRAQQSADILGDDLIRAKILALAGRIHQALGESGQSLDCLTTALALSREARPLEVADLNIVVYRALANIYSRLEDPDRAADFARRSLVIARQLGPDAIIADAVLFIGTIASREQERLYRLGLPAQDIGREALAWLDEVQPVAASFHNPLMEARLLCARSRVLLYLNSPHRSIELISNSLAHGTENLTQVRVSIVKLTLAEALLWSGEIERALQILNRALPVLEEHQAAHYVRTGRQILAQAYEQSGNARQALYNHKIVRAMSEQFAGVDIRHQAMIAALHLEAEDIRFESDRLRQARDSLVQRVRSLRTETERLGEVMRRDGLTDLANRRAFDEWLEQLFDSDDDAHASIALLDVDDFKGVNDRFSHAIGDEVLRKVAEILTQTVRYTDLVARYGGEEFALVLPDTPMDEAAAVCERVRAAIAETDWSTIQEGLTVTLSIGVSQERTAQAGIEMADQRLYEAKQGGRNQVVAG